MTDSVINVNEVRLNSVRYPTIDKIVCQLVSQMAPKQVIGDYDKTSDPNKDNWVIIGDRRGGLLVEEMDEKTQSSRAYWSNCDGTFKGHLVLGDIETEVDIPGWITPTGHVDETDDWISEAAAYDDNISGTYASSTAVPAGTYTGWLDLTIASQTISGVRVYANISADTANIKVEVFYGAAWHEIHADATVEFPANWNYFGMPDAQAVTACRIALKNNGGVARNIYIYEVDFFSESGTPDGSPVKFTNFNNQLYYAHGTVLMKLGANDTNLVLVHGFPQTITDILGSINSRIYVAQGTGYHYYYGTTADVFTITAGGTNDDKANLWVEWDGKLFCIDATTNIIYYTATPNTAAASWTANGTLSAVPAGAIKRLTVDRDASSSQVIYAGTTKGVWAHDYTNAKFIRPELKTPEHTNGGKGLVSWRGALYYTAGLNVHKYIPDDTPAFISSMGLDEDDGLPTEYIGEIVDLVEGFTSMYAFVDASQVAGTGYSTIMAYDGRGWRCIWEAATPDDAMITGIVSSDGGLNLWFDHDSKLYKLPLRRNVQHPLKVNGKTFRASGLHITPWFDADWMLGNKIAHRLRIEVAGNASTDESVTISYRINHSNTDRDTGWNPLGSAIVATGESTITFGSSLGVAFRSIQFKFALARAVASTTETPDILFATLEYSKALPKKWGWQFTADCTKATDTHSPEQLLDAIDTAAELETNMTFTFEDETKYVQVKSVSIKRLTGEGRRGEYTVFVQEV